MIVLGIDVGTTGTKTVAVNEKGQLVGSAYKEYELQTKAGGFVEQDANDWWDAVCFTVRGACGNIASKCEIAGISLSTQGASSVAVDSYFKPISPTITWMDTRCTSYAEELEKKIGKEYIYRCCGWAPDASSDIAKLLWMRDNTPDVLKKMHSYLSTIEFVNAKLTGQNIADPTNAAIRGFYDIQTLNWDDRLAEIGGIGRDKLPTVLPTGQYIGKLTPEAGEALGLPTSIPVYNGAHDQYCAAIGTGTLDAGEMLLSTGTTWVILGITDKPLYTDSYISPCVNPAGGYGAIGSLVSSGASLKWVKQNLVNEDYAKIDAEAEKRIREAKDVYFVPFLSGAGFPHLDGELSACLYGLRLNHNKYDVALALMEGVAFEAKLSLAEFERAGCPINRLTMIGGASKSRLWATITGYITGCEISLMQHSEACAYGAALIAAVNCGMFDSYHSAAKVISPKTLLDTTDKELQSFYSEKSEKYKKVLACVKSLKNL